jgi:threonine aldolase
MNGPVVDLRSDTVTRPDAGMRQAMASAEVGDDVYGEDPTVRALEQRAAERIGREAAIFMPTGTMGNQVAIHLQSRPGTDLLLDPDTHVYRYELGAMAAWSGVVPRLPDGGGRLDPEQLERALGFDAYYMARASMLVLENTRNHAGGRLLEPARQAALIDLARRHELALHLDGARLFNAAAVTGSPAARLAAGFDSVMFCLSKGLGAPVGSVLCGDTEFIREARVVRKRMGGGMRQAGVLAAAGLYALEHNIERLAEDHRRARLLAVALAETGRFELDLDRVESNIVIAETRGTVGQSELLDSWRGQGVLAGSMGPGRIRFVTHLDVDDAGLARAIEVICGSG